jgi:hypothetical protein
MDWEIKLVAAVIIIVVGVIGVSTYIIFDGFDMGIQYHSSVQSDYSIPDQSGFYLPTISGENISQYKASCTEINLNMPIYDLEQFKGHKVKIKGELIGVMQNMENSTNIQIKPNDLSLYPYIIVSYSTKIPYSLGDELEVYGELDSSANFENKDVPFIKAAYIEKL